MTEKSQITFKEILPYYGAFLVFLGVIRLHFFYGEFGVTIENFLDFSEIITSFFDILILIIIQFILSWFQSYFLRNNDDAEYKNEIFEKLKQKSHIFKRLKIYILYFGDLIITYLIYILIGILYHFFIQPIKIESLIFFLITIGICFSLGIFIMEIEIKHNKYKFSESEIKSTKILMFSLISISIVVLISYIQANNIKTEKNTFGTKIILKDSKEIISDENNYFIGNTKNYVFFYHEKSKITDVIPLSEIKQLSIKRKAIR
jgi:hypothetical protein